MKQDIRPIIDALTSLDKTRPFLIAIDGHSAAGKTTLSSQLRDEIPDVSVVHADDFYRVMDPVERKTLDAAGGYRLYFDWERLRDQVLEPLSTGSVANYQKYDWATNTLGEWETLVPAEVVVVEGCYSARPELKRYYSAVIFVKAPTNRRIAVQQERGDAWEWIERWYAAERHYFEISQPESYATLVWDSA